jgi:hypothetical protein
MRVTRVCLYTTVIRMQCIQGNPVTLYTKELHWCNLPLVNGHVFVNARKILVRFWCWP